MPEQPKLKRSLSLPLITFYGLGTILGAGIYVLVGKVADATSSFKKALALDARAAAPDYARPAEE